MKCRKNICQSCGDRSDQTHLHHILPKSKGGLDNPSNLIEVCPPCHQKIHDANFNGDTGLIKSGIEKAKKEDDESKVFMSVNDYSIMMFFEDFSITHETEILHEMMRFGVLSTLDFVRMLKGDKPKRHFGDLTKMVTVLHRENSHKYNFMFNNQ